MPKLTTEARTELRFEPRFPASSISPGQLHSSMDTEPPKHLPGGSMGAPEEDILRFSSTGARGSTGGSFPQWESFPHNPEPPRAPRIMGIALRQPPPHLPRCPFSCSVPNTHACAARAAKSRDSLAIASLCSTTCHANSGISQRLVMLALRRDFYKVPSVQGPCLVSPDL